jgi:Sulfatase-modifying factor enzyme 1
MSTDVGQATRMERPAIESAARIGRDLRNRTRLWGAGQWQDVLDEIDARLAVMAGAARSRGEILLPPLLVLGTSERVGSNWISDRLRPMLAQHNEPFLQQLGADHPLSPLNPRIAAATGSSCPAVGGLDRHWLVIFSVGKYGTTRQVVKETNLFFALPIVLALLPGAPVLVLSRSPLGVASSFTRGRLFERWGYRARYHQMITMVREGNSLARRFAALLPDDEPADLVALTRLQVLNAVLLADMLSGRNVTHIAYETAVIAAERALVTLTAVVPELGQLDPPPARSADCPEPCLVVEDTFVTTKLKTGLTADLEPADAEVVRATTAASLTAAQAVVRASAAACAAAWLAGDHLYRLVPLRSSPVAAGPPQPRYPRVVAPRYVRRGGLEVRNLLITNAELAGFLNALASAGMPNTHGGVFLLACEMPHERGGRLHLNTVTGRWGVSAEYEDHPAYWVTWIGAAAFAASQGARLPTRAEMMRLTACATAANAGYRFGDVTLVTEAGQPHGELHHLLGNLQVWCSDGPTPAECSGGPAVRWLYGVAWNTPATIKEAQRPRHRHILGCSRGVGIRLVRDGRCRQAGIGELAERLAAWISSLADRSRPLAEADERLIQALDASQADGGLGAHIASGAGESGHG